MVIGTGIGIALSRIRWLDQLFGALVVVGLKLPTMVIGIVFYVWLGLTEFALILAVMPLVVTTLHEGANSLYCDYDELALAFRML